MEIIKNNLVSIILGVVALVALTTPFWLLPGYTDTLADNARQSQANANTISTLLNKQRLQPGLDLEGQPKPLDRFPNQATIDAGDALQKNITATAENMRRTAEQINRRSMILEGVSDLLLVQGSLPRSVNNAQFVFRDRYNQLAREEILSKYLQGGQPPTQEQIAAKKAQLAQVIERGIRRFPDGTDNSAELKQQFDREAALIADREINQRADALRIYVDPGAFTWHPRVTQTGGQAPNPVEIWQAQLGLWIQTNFINAIREANKPAKNVKDATVKRLLRIEVADVPYVLQAAVAGAEGGGPMGGMAGMGGPSGGAVPMLPMSEGDPTAPLPKDFTKSVTGRVSNPLFDVVHFRALLHVEHARLPLLLQELGKDRLMYVRSMTVEAIDPTAMQLQGFVYGPQPTVQVMLEMEMLFMRAWTRDLMPDPMRIVLGIPPVNPTAAGMGAGMGDPSLEY